MNAGRAKAIGVSVLLSAFLLASINSMAASSLSVLDTDPGTYVIVVMLMLFVFMLFSLKEDLRFEYRKRNLAYGGALFAAYLLLASYLRVALSSEFQSFRVDALMFPLLLAAMIAALFGIDGIKRMRYLIVYSVFASPLILLPVLSLNNAFAQANTAVVYGFLRAIGAPVENSGLVISAARASSITISSTCVSLGIFAAMAMFLLPLAYMYEGRRASKALWFVSGCALLLAMNVLRMLLLSLMWAYYGIGAAIGAFHAVAGQVLFYVAIVAMVLLACKYGLYIKKAARGRSRKRDSRVPMALAAPSSFVVALGLAAFVVSSQYGAALYAPALLFSGNASSVSGAAIQAAGLRSLENAGTSIVQIGSLAPGYVFALQGNSSGSSTYVVLTPLAGPARGAIVTAYDSLSGARAYIMRNGITLKSAIARSGNLTFDVNYFAIPYNFSGSYLSINYELFRQVQNGTTPSCAAVNASSLGIANYFASEIHNALELSLDGGRGIMCESYRIAEAAG